jgi:hypothetical protein
LPRPVDEVSRGGDALAADEPWVLHRERGERTCEGETDRADA